MYLSALSSGKIHSPIPVFNNAYSPAEYPKVKRVASKSDAPAYLASP
nr:MAG TPA: hypothetical protein [Bacteriophage sp.]DAU17820.1 MAG TPA: hypothetical protein [Bacteriophage sp.]